MKFQNGFYINKSANKTLLNSVETVINPEIDITSIEDKIALVFPPKNGILLFKAKEKI